MAVAYQSFASAANAGASPVVTKPTGTVSGDGLVAFVLNFSPGSAITPPAGWTLKQGTSTTDAIYEKTAGGSEPANYTWTTALFQGAHVLIIRVTGQKSAPFVEAQNFIAYAVVNTSVVIPTVTSGGAGRLLFQCILSGSSNTWTPPGTAVERFDALDPNNYARAGGDETVGSGATGTRTWTPNSQAFAGGFMVAIAPATVINEVTGSAAGAGTVTGVGAGIDKTQGSAAGVSTPAGSGSGVGTTTGSSTGSGTAAGAAASVQPTTGSSAGVGSPSGVGEAVTVDDGTGTSSGAATATGDAAATAAGTGSSDGSATAGAEGVSVAPGTGSAAGSGTAAGVGDSDTLAGGTGSAAGTATASGGTGIIAAGTGSSAGAAAVTGSADDPAATSATGSSAGSGTVAGVAAGVTSATGSSAGTSSVVGYGGIAKDPAHLTVTIRESGRTHTIGDVSRTHAVTDQSRKTTIVEGIA